MSSSGLIFNIARIASWSGVISVTSPVAGELPMGFVKWSNTALVTRLTFPSPGTETSTPSSRACLSLYSTITFDCSSIRDGLPSQPLVPPQSTVHLTHAVTPFRKTWLPSEEANEQVPGQSNCACEPFRVYDCP